MQNKENILEFLFSSEKDWTTFFKKSLYELEH